MNKQTVATTIINQLGNRALSMIGAKNLCAGKRDLSFKIGRNAKKVTHVTIELNDSDLYNITFLNIRGMQPKKEIACEKNIYADVLEKSIEFHTGLYTSL